MSVEIIAEAGVNHNGSLAMALDLIDLAAEAGADTIKFQSFIPAEVISRQAAKAPYQRRLSPVEESQLEMAAKLKLGEEEHRRLLERCRRRKIRMLSTPFDLPSVKLLTEELRLGRLKAASGEITNAPLLLEMARTGVEIILSTGMSSLGEIETALAVLAFGYTDRQSRPSPAAFQASYASAEGQQALRRKVTLLHCTSSYPAPPDEINLLAMDTLRLAFGLRVGYSDHSLGIVIPVAAAAKGAALIEKHFTLDRNLPGPDHQASLEPEELKAMAAAIRQVEKALGSPRKVPTPSEVENRPLVRRSLVARDEIRPGDLFGEVNLGIKRPGGGIEPIYYWEYLGRRSERGYRPDEQIK